MSSSPRDETKPHNSAVRSSGPGSDATTLPEAMTGRASPAKAAVGDAPVLAYIASLPQPQRGIAEAVDALAATTLPDLERSVKWGMAYYGVGDGWCFNSGGFAGHVKLMFINGAALEPTPPVTPVGMGEIDTRCGARIGGRPRRSPDRSLDEASRVGAWCRRQETLKLSNGSIRQSEGGEQSSDGLGVEWSLT